MRRLHRSHSELEELACHHGEVLDDRPKRERGEEGEAAEDQDHAHKQPTNRPPWVGNVPVDGGLIFLPTSEPATAIIGTITK